MFLCSQASRLTPPAAASPEARNLTEAQKMQSNYRTKGALAAILPSFHPVFPWVPG